jgi:hypothetical protein
MEKNNLTLSQVPKRGVIYIMRRASIPKNHYD